MIRTFEEARLLIRDLKICTIFESSKSELPSLWEYVDLPEKQEGEKGWGQKVSAVWDWKNRLPATFPDEIFYGKIKGGFAVLMTIDCSRSRGTNSEPSRVARNAALATNSAAKPRSTGAPRSKNIAIT